ncbi:retrovirus-related pol polyprotein from transposon TNT 1-94 [Tanacetum coccineum]
MAKNEVNEIRFERLARTANPFALVSQQQPVYHPQTCPTHYTQSSSTRSQQAATRNRAKAIINSPQPTYNLEPKVVVDDDASSKEKDIDKLMALILMYFKKIYQPTNNNLRTSSNTRNNNVDNTLRSNRGTRYDRQTRQYDNQRTVNVAGAMENVAHYLYMAKVQEVSPDYAANSVPIFDVEPILKVHNSDDDYTVFSNDRQHPEQPEPVNDTYSTKQGDTNITYDSSNMSNNGEEADHDYQMIKKERELLASLIEQLKVEIDARVILTTSVSRPQLKSTQLEDRVLHNNSQGKKQEVEDHARRDNSVHRRLWVLKAHVGKSQASKSGSSECHYQEGNDLLTGSRGLDLYLITLQETISPNPIFLMAKATSSQAWLWHHCISHMNFDTINLLSKNDIVIGLSKLKFVIDHLCSSYLCGPIRVESINGKKYVLVIVDDYSRYTWTHFLRSKDETLKVLIDFLRLVQSGLHAQVRIVRTNKGTKFLNKTLHDDFSQEGIEHQTSVAQTPKQNGVVERRNRTLVESARTMLSVAKVTLFFLAEAIAIACFAQNCLLVIPQHGKTPYHIINGRKPTIKFFHIFGCLCYTVRDGENLNKMKEKGDACIFVGYSTQSRGYRVYNKRTRLIVETIHVNFDKLPLMASDHVSSDPNSQCPTTVLEQDILSPNPKSKENVPHTTQKITTSNELDFLFSLMFKELFNGSTIVVSNSFDVPVADVSNKRQQQNITTSTSTTVVADTTSLNIQTTPETTSQAPTQAPTVNATENINQAYIHKENALVYKDKFINCWSMLMS